MYILSRVYHWHTIGPLACEFMSITKPQCVNHLHNSMIYYICNMGHLQMSKFDMLDF